MRMRHTITLLLAAFLSAPGLAAQDRETTARSTLQDLVVQFEAARVRWLRELTAFGENEEYRSLRAAGEYQAAAELREKHTRRPHLDLLGKFDAAAMDYRGEAQEALFLVWMAACNTSAKKPDPLQERALARLLDAHLDNPLLEPLVTAGENAGLYRWLGYDRFLEVLGTVAAATPHKAVRAHALYCRAIFTLELGNRASTPPSTEQEAAAEEDMKKAATLLPGSTLALRAAAKTFERERLQVGMVAPDIEGEDLDGEWFKLSDYRGKVVVLDFWGDW